VKNHKSQGPVLFFVSAVWRLHYLDQLCHSIVYQCSNFQCSFLRYKESFKKLASVNFDVSNPVVYCSSNSLRQVFYWRLTGDECFLQYHRVLRTTVCIPPIARIQADLGDLHNKKILFQIDAAAAKRHCKTVWQLRKVF
jgi:hypothetical protein